MDTTARLEAHRVAALPASEHPLAGTPHDPARILAHYPEGMNDHYLEMVSIHAWRKKKIPGKTLTLLGKTITRADSKVDAVYSRYFLISELRRRPDELREYVHDKALKGYQTYWRRCSTYRFNARGCSTIPGMRLMPSLAIDLDGVDPKEALARIRAVMREPSFALPSGPRGLHLYWDLRQPISAALSGTIMPSFLAHAREVTGLPVDECPDATRLLRLPGSVNLKTFAKHRSKFMDAETYRATAEQHITEASIAAAVLDRPDLRYDLSDLLPWVDDDLIHARDREMYQQQEERAERRLRGATRPAGEGPTLRAVPTKNQEVSKQSVSPRSPAAAVNSLVDPLAEDPGYKTFKTAREMVFPLAVRPTERIHDPDFQAHIQSVIALCPKPRRGHRAKPMAAFVSRLRSSYAGPTALTESECLYAHDVWIEPYDGETDLESSRRDLIYTYTTMPTGDRRRYKEDWIKLVEERGLLPHPLRDRIQGRRDGVATAQRLADVMYTSCVRPTPDSDVQPGRVAMARRTVMEVLGCSRGTADRTLERLEKLELVEMVCPGDRATGKGSEFVCLDEQGEAYQPE